MRVVWPRSLCGHERIGHVRIMLFRKVRKSTRNRPMRDVPTDHYHLIRGSTRATDCQACADGSVAPSGSSSCQPCPIGKRQTGVSSCTPCRKGFYGGGEADPCLPCPVGTFGVSNASISEADGCQPCQKDASGRSALVCLERRIAPRALLEHSERPRMWYVNAATRDISACMARRDARSVLSAGKRLAKFEQSASRAIPGKYGNDLRECVDCPVNTYASVFAANSSDMCVACLPVGTRQRWRVFPPRSVFHALPESILRTTGKQSSKLLGLPNRMDFVFRRIGGVHGMPCGKDRDRCSPRLSKVPCRNLSRCGAACQRLCGVRIGHVF